MTTDNNFRVKNGLTVGSGLVATDSGSGLGLLGPYIGVISTSTGDIDLYTNNFTADGVEVWLQHNNQVAINTANGAYSWQFKNTGNLVFPNNTVQTSAFIGSTNTVYVGDILLSQTTPGVLDITQPVSSTVNDYANTANVLILANFESIGAAPASPYLNQYGLYATGGLENLVSGDYTLGLMAAASTSGSEARFGDSSLLLGLTDPSGYEGPGTPSLVVLDGDSNFLSGFGSVGSGAYTIDSWIYIPSANENTSDKALFCWAKATIGGDPGQAVVFGMTGAVNSKVLYIGLGTGPKTILAQGTTIVPEDQWVHLAYFNDGTNTYLAVNGSVEQVTLSDSLFIEAPSEGVHFMTAIGYEWGLDNVGYLDNFRISSAQLFSTAGFVPPSETDVVVNQTPAEIQVNQIIVSSTSTNYYVIDAVNNAYTLALDETITFNSFSGHIIINDTYSGYMYDFLVGGGSIWLSGSTNPNWIPPLTSPGSSVTIADYVSMTYSGGYIFTNLSSISTTFGVYAVRTRTGA